MPKNYKSSNFLSKIDNHARRQRLTITDEIKKIEQYELKKAEAEIVEDVNSLIQKELAAMRNKIAVKISRKELSERRKISLKRQSMMKEIFKNCKEKLIEFTLSKEYLKSLEEYASKISNVLKSSDAELYIKESDMKYADKIMDGFGRECKIKVLEDILIGGIRGFSAGQGLVADETLDAKLEEQRDWAVENFGVQLI